LKYTHVFYVSIVWYTFSHSNVCSNVINLYIARTNTTVGILCTYCE